MVASSLTWEMKAKQNPSLASMSGKTAFVSSGSCHITEHNLRATQRTRQIYTNEPRNAYSMAVIIWLSLYHHNESI